MWGRVVKVALSLPFLIVAGVFGAYLIAGFFLVNPLAQQLLPWLGEAKFASQLSAQQVKFNPLTLEATVTGLKLAERNGAPLASFDRLYVNLDTTGLFRWAWRIQDIQLDKPRATVLVRSGGRLNWQDLIDKVNEDKEPPSDSIARVLVEHIRMADGDIDYTDANRAGQPFKVVLAPLGIELDGLSTLPEDRGDYLVAAKLPEQGGTLKWKGDVGLNPLASAGQIGLEGVRLGNLLRVIKSPRNFELPSGVLAAGLNYQFVMVRNQAGKDLPSLQVKGANLRVNDLTLAPRGGGAPVLQLREASVSHANVDLLRHMVDAASVRLSGAQLAATRNVAGVLDWQTLFAPASAGDVAPTPTAAAKADPAPTWKIALHEIALAEWSARFTDQGYATPLTAKVNRFDLTAAVAGEVGATPALTVGPVKASLGPVELRSGEASVATLARVELDNARLALADQRLDIDALTLSGATAQVVMEKDKTLNWAHILQKAPGASASVPAPAPKTADASPLQIALARFALDGVNVGFTDQTTIRPVRLDLVDGFVKLRDLNLDLTRSLPFEAGFAIKQGGRFDASGTLAPAPVKGEMKLKLAGLSLKPFAPYLNTIVRLNLNRGTVGASGKLKLAASPQPGKPLSLAFDGGFSVDKLDITEEESGDSFLGWERLASDNLKLGLAPNRLHMTQLRAIDPFAKILIHVDGTRNIQKLMRSQPAKPVTPAADEKEADETAAAQDESAAAPASPPPAAPPGPPVKSASGPVAFPVEIEQLRIDNGKLDFADLSLTPKFGTLMHSLSGVINSLSTDPATVAQLELDGKVDEFGSARIRGTVQPFQATEFTDIKLTFRNLEMTSMTPYSGKFAGRKIDSGKLSVDLEYKVRQRQLAGENKFVINRIKLGERVEGPDVKHLPLDLAIALLEDSNGVIDLDLPISGSLDDPKFSYGKIIWKAIVNVLTKLVTAPFRALGKLLGINSEHLEAIHFDPGSGILTPPEQEKLKTLSEAMAKRPALTLTLEPGYDPEADRRALQEQALRREVAVGVGVKLAPNEEAGPVDVNNYKVQTWLEDRYAESVGKAEYQTLRASYKAKGDGNLITDNAMVERLGRVFKTRDTGPASALHTELLEQLTQKTSIDDAALTRLAQARGQAMREGLLKYGLEGGRVSVAEPVKQTAKDKLVGSKMSLGAAGVASTAPAVAPATPQP
jgi:uncharacterized protein involved in outer membrane biogenesis